MGYLKVKENEDSEIVEIPTEEDGTLSLEVLQNMYAGVTGLKYNIDGHTRLLKVSDGKILAPSEGWDSSPIYYCVYPKGTINAYLISLICIFIDLVLAILIGLFNFCGNRKFISFRW